MPSRAHAFRARRAAFSVSRLLAIAAVAAAALVFATLPPSPRQVTGADPALASRTVRGAFHVHTTRSDGVSDKASVARAARRAGLQFVVFTDHGDGTRQADAPEYVDGVLALDGVEVSTDGGHYIAVGAAPSPYPLGGESAAVVEDVRRLGGLGVAAHPGSPRRELAWSDWSLPIDAVEWLNADSEWRDEGRWPLARALIAYPWRPSGALGVLLDRPESTLARWDAAASGRRILGFAGHDAHGGIGRRLEEPGSRLSLRIPSYEAGFRTFSTCVELDRPFTGDPAADGRALLDTLGIGRFYTEVSAVASRATLEFSGRTAEDSVQQGSLLRGAGLASFTVRAPALEGAEIVAFRNGASVARASGGSLRFESNEMGTYRVEVQVAGAPGVPPIPWLVSNPIFRLAPVPAPASPERSVVLPLASVGWRIEKESGSSGAVRANGDLAFEYQLRPGPRVSQFVALVRDLSALPPFEAIAFTARASRPHRLSVQLRFAGDGDARWGRSVYIDGSARAFTLDLGDLRRIDGADRRPDSSRATSLLFVVDLTHAAPGDSGVIRLEGVSLAR